MENKHLKEQEGLNKEESVSNRQVPHFLKQKNFNQSLTNEQKLEYLSILIQSVEQKLETRGIFNKLVKRWFDFYSSKKSIPLFLLFLI